MKSPVVPRPAADVVDAGADARLPPAARSLFPILRLCARVDVQVVLGSRPRALLGRSAGPWDDLPTAAERHGILPLVARRLAGADGVAIPPAVRDELQAVRRRWTAEALTLTGALAEVLDALAEAGLRAVPFKGPVLAADLYGGVAERQYGDLDVLVGADDLEPAVELLMSREYEPAEPTGPTARRLRLRREGVVPLRHPSGARVELHGTVFPSGFSLPLTLEALATVERGGDLPGLDLAPGTPLRTLSPEDRLLVLTAHGGKHLWCRLAWVADVARLLEQTPALDWPRVAARAEEMGARRLLEVGVLLAGELLGAPVPRPVREAPSEAVRGRVAACREGLRTGRGEPTGPVWWWRVMKLRERWSDRARSFLALFRPTVVDVTALRLPDVLRFLYWPLRPLRLLRKYGRRAWRRRVRGRAGDAPVGGR